jgi:hypothetical protein
MATVSLRLPSSLAGAPPAAARRGFWRRWYDALVEAQMRKARLEINRYRHLIPTDEVEEAGYRIGQTGSGALPFVR